MRTERTGYAQLEESVCAHTIRAYYADDEIHATCTVRIPSIHLKTEAYFGL